MLNNGDDTTDVEGTTQSEMSTAISYYSFYASRPFTTGEDTSSTTADDDGGGDGSYWKQDTWTEQDLQRAQQVLEQHEYKSTNNRGRSSQQADCTCWDSFYTSHQTNFFRDRHYLAKAFPLEFDDNQKHQQRHSKSLIEIGCGVGNNILPLLEHDAEAIEVDSTTARRRWNKIWAFDLSQVAIDLLRQDVRFIKAAKEDRVHASVWDITCTTRQPPVVGQADIACMLFCLSAVPPSQQKVAMHNVARTLVPGGILVFRDYGRFDEAQMKLATGRNKRLEANYYIKHDGTKCFYFELEELKRLVQQAGLQVVELEYIRRVYRNRSQDQERRRVWVQGRFQKPR